MADTNTIEQIDNAAAAFEEIKAQNDPAEQLRDVNREAKRVIRALHSDREINNFQEESNRAVALFRGHGFDQQADIIEGYASQNPGDLSRQDAVQARSDAQSQLTRATLDAREAQVAETKAAIIVEENARNDKMPLNEYIQHLAAQTGDAISNISMEDIKAKELELAGGEEGLQKLREDLESHQQGVPVDEIPTSADYTQDDVAALLNSANVAETIASIPDGLNARIAETENQLPEIQDKALADAMLKAEEIVPGVMTGSFSHAGGAGEISANALVHSVGEEFPENSDVILDRLEGIRPVVEAGYHEKMESSSLPVDIVETVQDTVINSAMTNVINSKEFSDAMESDSVEALQQLPDLVQEEVDTTVDQKYGRFMPSEASEQKQSVSEVSSGAQADMDIQVQERYDHHKQNSNPYMQDKMLELFEKQGIENADVEALRQLQQERNEPVIGSPAAAVPGM